MTRFPIFITDAFVGTLSHRRLLGNPAAVALLDAPQNEAWMQEVAAEMNLSETAFVVPKDANHFDLRWFTPTCEVDLCGHATLASAHVLWDSGRLDAGQSAHFHTLSGILTAQKRGERIALDFPAQESAPCEAPRGLATALGTQNHRIIGVHRGGDDLLVEIGHENEIELLTPNFGALRQICTATEARGVIATVQAQVPVDLCGYDFASRFFGPAVGIDEDPVTGSAHTKLAPFWGAKLGKTEMIGFQNSQRGGLVEMNWQGARVDLCGAARSRMRGEWVS